ncbi:MAG: hypothetical protein HOP17_11900 [Acidobacteria bacterium]|nr:hypothetical protein [Acidobacteriota bacterium]
MIARAKIARSYKARYPELYQFFAGYFYQGWVSDYKWDLSEPSFKAVVRHFRAVNPPSVVEAVRTQLDEFISFDAVNEDDLADALFELGSGFNPDFEGLSKSDWLKQIVEVLSESAAASMVLRERH